MPTIVKLYTMRCLALVLPLALALCLPGLAQAQLSKDDQKCVNEVNKNFAKLAKTLGKDICACIKDGAKGKLTDPNTIEECLLADRKGKVDKATIKLFEKLASKCPPSYDPNFPTVDPSDPNAIAAAAVDKELVLIHTIFGPDLDAVIVKAADPNNPTSKDESKCQQAIAKQAKKCQDTKLKVFVKCKKDKLKGKLPPAATSASDLQDECLGIGTAPMPDPKGKIAKDCDTKLVSTFDKKCAGLASVDSLFDCGSGLSATSLRDCVDFAVECEVCTALNAVDGLARDCDEFDDGVANGSCGGTAPADCGDTFPLCDGDCTTVGFVCSDVGGVCVCGPPACGDTLAPTCDGDCPPGDVCTDVGGSCACEPPACGLTLPPTCGGDCPPGSGCTDIGGTCACLPECGGSSPPMCDGSCTGVDSCVVAPGGGSCVCIPGGAGIGPCGCGDPCMYDCGLFGGVIPGFCVIKAVSAGAGCFCSGLCPGLPPDCPGMCTSAPCFVHCPGGGEVPGECEFPVPPTGDDCMCTNTSGALPPCP